MRLEGLPSKEFRRALKFVLNHANIFIEVVPEAFEITLVSYDAHVLLTAPVPLPTLVSDDAWTPCLPQHTGPLLFDFLSQADAEFTLVADPEAEYVGFVSGLFRLMLPGSKGVLPDWRSKVQQPQEFLGLNPAYLIEEADRFAGMHRMRMLSPVRGHGLVLRAMDTGEQAVVMPTTSADPMDINVVRTEAPDADAPSQPTADGTTAEAEQAPDAAPSEFPE